MKSKNNDKKYYVMFLLLIFAAAGCGFLVSKGILPQPFWLVSVLLLAFSSTVYNRRNYVNSQKDIEERRKRRAARKNQNTNRYL